MSATVGGVIDVVDSALARLLADVVQSVDAAVTFEQPSPTWADALDKPYLNVFLCDLVEALDGLDADWTDIRDNTGRVFARRPPIRHYWLTYVVSAWALDVATEHRLLGLALATLAANSRLDCSAAAAGAAGEPVVATVAVAQPGAVGGGDASSGAGANTGSAPRQWPHIGLPARAFFTIAVRLPIQLAQSTEVAPPAESLDLNMGQVAAGKPAVATSDTSDTEVQNRNWTSFRIREKHP